MTPLGTRLGVVTVTYHPDQVCLERQVAALPEEALLVLVDNGSNISEVTSLQRLVALRPNTRLIRNNANIGLAAALNKGVNLVATTGIGRDFVLLMDQDSVPYPGAVEELLRSFLHLEQEGRSVGCVGPQLLDEGVGLQHGFHCIQGWRWVRRFPAMDCDTPIRCANLNGSGTLMRVDLFHRLGGVDEQMFIDHVDTDWAFRVLALDLALYGIPSAIFSHAMGERVLRFWWFGWRLWPQRSPKRHYFLFRNTVRLLRRDNVPGVWKVWAVVKLALTLLVHTIFDSRRREQAGSMLMGLRDGYGID